MNETLSRLLLAQSLGEYGALSGFTSALDRFGRFADDIVRNPRSSVPIGIAGPDAVRRLLTNLNAR
jgi:hypothetical protein